MTLDVNVNVDVNKILAELEAIVREAAPHVWQAALHQVYAQMVSDIVWAGGWALGALALLGVGFKLWRLGGKQQKAFDGLVAVWIEKSGKSGSYLSRYDIPGTPDSIFGYRLVGTFSWMMALTTGGAALYCAQAAVQLALAPDWAAIQIVKTMLAL